MAETFGQRLRRAIEASPHNQKRLAALLGVRPETVTNWVADDYLPGGEHLVRLPDLLGVSGHFLLTGEGPMRREAPTLSQEQIAKIRQVLAEGGD